MRETCRAAGSGWRAGASHGPRAGHHRHPRSFSLRWPSPTEHSGDGSFLPPQVPPSPPKQLQHPKLVGWDLFPPPQLLALQGELAFAPAPLPPAPALRGRRRGSTICRQQRSPALAVPIPLAVRPTGSDGRRRGSCRQRQAGRHAPGERIHTGTAGRGCWGIVIIVLQRRVLPAGGGVEGGEERGREKVRGEHAAGLGPEQRRCWRGRAEALRGAACPSSLGGTGGRSEAGTIQAWGRQPAEGSRHRRTGLAAAAATTSFLSPSLLFAHPPPPPLPCPPSAPRRGLGREKSSLTQS